MATNPDREAAIGEGIGLVKAGHSLRAAAELVGVPTSTLHRAYHLILGPDAPNRVEERKRADERLLATAYAVADQALGRMASEIGHAEHRTVTAWAEVSSRIVGRIRGWDAKSAQGSEIAPRWLQALSGVLENGGATLTVTLEPTSDTDNANESK